MKEKEQKYKVLDLEELKQNSEDGVLNESFLRMFGGFLKGVLNRIFGGSNIPVKVRGKRKDVKSFANAVKGEKDYMKSLKDYGLDDPKTYDSKYKLDKAIKKFEKETGLKWPFS